MCSTVLSVQYIQRCIPAAVVCLYNYHFQYKLLHISLFVSVVNVIVILNSISQDTCCLIFCINHIIIKTCVSVNLNTTIYSGLQTMKCEM